MPIHQTHITGHSRGWVHRTALMTGVSAAALLVMGTSLAQAGQLSAALSSRSSASAAASAAAAASLAAQQAATVTARVTTDLAKTAASLKAALAAQASAKAMAATASTTVTDGLSANGLVVDPRVGTAADLWANISLPVETVANGQYTETLTQTSARAIATWYKFDIGKNTTVHFDQSAGNSTYGNSWVVLNRIDATGVPSQILGTIKAEGTVLVINPNGIIFGAGSQVNVHSLIASSLDINSYTGTNYGVFANSNGSYIAYDKTVAASTSADGNTVYAAAGEYTFAAPNDETNGNTQFLGNGLYTSTYLTSSGTTNVTHYNLILSAGSGQDSNGNDLSSTTLKNYGITVQKGATISTVNNVSGFDNGGYVALVGPSVTNAGRIETSAGEIALAAGSLIYLAEPTSSATSYAATIYNPSSSGVEYAPPAVSGGAITLNDSDGVLYSGRGNITLVGDTIEQNGIALATTSITRPGSIIITASGTTTFGADSITAIVSAENGETIGEGSIATGYTAPSITIITTNLDMASGSLIVAPSATMTVDSTETPGYGGAYSPLGRVLLESGSVIDLGGMAATASVSDYLYSFKVTANDVADTPLAKSLIGKTVTIDLRLTGTRADGETWVGSPLFAATGAGYLGNVATSLDQLLSGAGSLKIGTSIPFFDVLTAMGSIVNVSGGAVTYTGGRVTTTNLVTADGRIANIGSADPFVSYIGLGGTETIDHAHWGVTEIYINPLTGMSRYVDPGYIDGLSAGAVGITATNPILEGFIEGDTYTGSRQASLSVTASAASITTPDDMPTGASLAVTMSGDHEVVLARSADDLLSGATLTSDLPTIDVYGVVPTITYSTDLLTSDNLGSITIKGATALSMEAGASLIVRAGGAITFDGATEIDGSLVARGGSISLADSVAAVTIGSTATLDVSGLWVNDAGRDNTTLQGWAWINGGAVSITTDKSSAPVGSPIDNNNTYETVQDTSPSIVLASGSIIDLSSGGYVTIMGAVKTGTGGLPAGTGGSLTLQTDAGGSWGSDTGDGGYFSYPLAPTTAPSATVVFGGTIDAGGLNKGGTLTLQVPAIAIDGTATTISTDSSTGILTLPTSFFSQGFSTYKLTSTYGSVTVTAGTTLTLKQQNYLISADTTLPATGAKPRDFATLGYAADGLRQPVNLSLTEQAVTFNSNPESTDAGIVIGQGAAIIADPQASVALSADQAVTVLGDIVAHGGTISLYSAQNVWIGSQAGLDVSGIFVANPQVTAYPTGSVLDGGSISISSGGEIIALKGSTFDIAGASATIQVPTGGTGQFSPGTTSEAIWSDGGTLTLYSSALNASTASLYFAGTIEAAGGVSSASGGTLNIGMLFTVPGSGGQPSYDVEGYNTILIAQSGDVTASFAGDTPPATAAQLSSLTSGLVLTTTSTTSNSISIYTTETFTIQKGLSSQVLTGNSVTVGDGNGDTMTGKITSYDPSTGNLAIYTTSSTGPSGATSSAWTVSIANSAAFITADTINTAHLDSLSLTGTTIAFSGNVALKIPNALDLNGNIALLPAGITPSSALAAYAATTTSGGINAIGAPTVTLNAGYIRWLAGPSFISTAVSTLEAGVAGDGTLNLDASAQIDLAGVISASDADAVNLTVSDGDIRFLPTRDAEIEGYFQGLIAYGGNDYTLSYTGGSASTGEALLVPGDLTLTAREVYPATSTTFLLASLGQGGSSGGTITFKSDGQTPTTPYSAGGTLVVDAATIVQAGVIEVPLGSIILGFSSAPGFGGASLAATSNLTLAAGSLTSTSANGVYIPYGTTVDGENWVSSPPSKLIVLAGDTVTTESGAVIDESGGGDIYASEFVAGTGGSRNVLTGLTSTDMAPSTQVYALVPAYEAAIAAYDPTFGPTGAPGGTAVTVKHQSGSGVASTYIEAANADTTTTYDPALAAGTAVTLSGGNGIAAGTYVLLPAMYATLPGAYRVAVLSTNTGSSATHSTTAADGSIYMTGALTNAITGAKSSATALFEIQSNAVWTKYSEIDIHYGDAYFTTLATANGTATPRLAEDAGQMIIAAATKLTLGATNDFTAASGGRGGEIDITGSNILVLASGLSESSVNVTAGDIVLDADQISNLGVESVLLGGYRTITASGTLITATAENLEVDTDSAHALSGPEVLLVSFAPATASPSVTGLVVDAGSVIAAKGTVSSASADALIIGVDPVAQYQTNADGSKTLTGYSAGVSGDGALLRVSNGGAVTVTRNYVPGIYTGPGPLPASGSGTALGGLSVGAGADLSGHSLTLDSAGVTTVSDTAVLSAKAYDLAGGVINVGGGSGGLVLSPVVIAQMAGADSVTLQSLSVINFHDGASLGTATAPIGTLTLDGAALASDGTDATIDAANLVFKNSQTILNPNGGAGGVGGALTLDATGTLTFGAGIKTTQGFTVVNAIAGKDILFSGTGSLDVGSAAVTLTAPFLVADTGASQSLTTTGALAVAQGTGTAPTIADTVYGGSLALTGGSIADSGTIVAPAGKVTLEATAAAGDGLTGDVVLSGSAAIKAAGTEIALGDLTEDVPAGTVKLISDKGDVTLGANSLIDVSAAGTGYGGTLGIEATGGTVTFGGTLKGGAAYNDLGGTFLLVAGARSGDLPISSGFTGAFKVELGSGDITIAQGQQLTSNTVLLSTDQGTVTVDGTIDASGQTAGAIGLYAACLDSSCTTTGGVVIGPDAKLYARYQADSSADPAYSSTASQNGGTITLGTSGKPNGDGTSDPDGAYNSTYGYENVAKANSGIISVASGAILDVSGGSSGTGGTVDVRAPLLEDGTVNVSFAGTLVTNATTSGDTTPSGGGVVLNAFAVWSTDDKTSAVSGTHFDGIIDPAGWYDKSGTLMVGSFYDASGNDVADWSGSSPSLASSPLTSTGTSTSSSTSAATTKTTTSYSWDGATFTTTTVTTSTAGSTINITTLVTVVTAAGTTTTTTVNGWTCVGSGCETTTTTTNTSNTDAATYIAAVENYLLANFYFTPTQATNTDHVYFYQNTLLNFVNNPFDASALAKNDFSGAKIQLSGSSSTSDLASYSLLHLRPEIDLINPDKNINSGNITVASNWNLGAGSEDAAGNVSLLYRTSNGGEPGVLALRALNDVQINATITDGFYTPYSVSDIAETAYDTETASSFYQTYLSYFSNGVLTYNGKRLTGTTYTVNADFYGISQDLFNTLEFTLQKPITMTCGGNASSCSALIDQYKQFYVEYAKLFDFYAFYVSCANTGGDACGYPNKGLITSYSDFLSYYGIIGSMSDLPAFPSQPTDSVLYYNIKNNGIMLGGTSDYASAYATYIIALYDGGYADIFNSTSFGGNGAVVTDPSSYIGTITGLSYSSAYALTDLETAIANSGLPIRLGAAPPYAPVAYTTLYASTYVATSTLQPPADRIANNPTTYNNVAVYNTTTASALMSATVSGKGSFSYDIVAGAKFNADGTSSVDPDTVLTVSERSADGLTGDVIVSGHISYANPLTNSQEPTITVPTVVRTGTGSIDIAAAGDFILADTTAPGAVYTAGTAIDTSTISDFTALTLTSAYTSNPNGQIGAPTWATGGGSVTIAVGGNIEGVETSGLDGAGNWGTWYFHAIKTNGSTTPFSSSDDVQTQAWVNYATYADGIGALGGGNVTLKAGGGITDLIVSLPETILAAGGTTTTPTETGVTYGGGNLSVTASNIVGSAFWVGQGTGILRVASAAAVDSSGNGLELAVQDGFITVVAGGAMILSGIYDPAELTNDSAYANTGDDGHGAFIYLPGYISSTQTSTLGTTFSSYSTDSGISLTSVSGDVALGSSSAPATLIVDAIGGGITGGDSLIPSSSGTLTLLAGGSISYSVSMLDGTAAPVGALGTSAPTVLSQALHAADDTPVILYAGEDLSGSYDLIKPAKVWAGRDMIDVQFTGQNNLATDVTSIITGRDNTGGSFTLYGPGDFLVEAGRNLGPFIADSSGGGIFAVGDGSNSGGAVIPYLPVAGANITVLYGVGGGIDTTDAISKYVDTTTGGISFISSITSQLETTLDTLASQATSSSVAATELNTLLANWGLSTVSLTGGLLATDTPFTLSDAQALSIFQTKLSSAKRDLAVDRALLDVLTQVSTDYSDPSSTYYQQYARAYQAISTLFPASLGYTDNSTAGGVNGAATTVTTGTMRMAHSLVETQTGGDITILGPGGPLWVGSNASDQLTPSQQGILTLQGGSVNISSDQNVMVFQSRIFTEQGGDIDIFSANGDINAGKGQKSKTAYPKLTLICDTDGYCRVSPVGLVSGAGIGALVTIPGQNPDDSNMTLSAPHGTVDAGAAGIRVAGNLNIVALHVLNAFNIDVGGKAIGIPMAASPNLGALTAASDTAGSAASAAEQAARNSRPGPRQTDLPSIITIEVIGYGGTDGKEKQDNERDKNRQKGNEQSSNGSSDKPVSSYRTTSAVQILGSGALTDEESQYLTREEKRTLAQPDAPTARP